MNWSKFQLKLWLVRLWTDYDGWINFFLPKRWLKHRVGWEEVDEPPYTYIHAQTRRNWLDSPLVMHPIFQILRVCWYWWPKSVGFWTQPKAEWWNHQNIPRDYSANWSLGNLISPTLFLLLILLLSIFNLKNVILITTIFFFFYQ